MIDPFNITQFNRTKAELEEFLVFGVCVAGKTASTIARQVHNFLQLETGKTPFAKIRKMIKKGTLRFNMESARLGQYGLLERSLREMVKIDMTTATVDQLEQVPKCGPKTARFVMMHSVPGLEVAALDRHILAYLRSKGIEAPKTNPPAGPKYRRLEQEFIKIARELGKAPCDLDLEVWKSYTASKPEVTSSRPRKS